jgi:hypothetical protein
MRLHLSRPFPEASSVIRSAIYSRFVHGVGIVTFRLNPSMLTDEQRPLNRRWADTIHQSSVGYRRSDHLLVRFPPQSSFQPLDPEHII